jgi:hypothetical protein
MCSQIATIHEQLRTPTGLRPFFLVKLAGGAHTVGAVEDYEAFFEGVPVDDVSRARPTPLAARLMA